MEVHGKAGTIGGTLLTVIANIQGIDLMNTCILATVGAVVSFCVSMALKWAVKRVKGKGRSQ